MNTAPHRERLISERGRLEGEMSKLGRPSMSVPGEWDVAPKDEAFEPDTLDQAERITSREDDASVLADLGARHKAVVAALELIENGTYGSCEVCGASIEPKRLSADPAAATCARHR